ncbi:MAG: hypothetical protein H8D92_00645 [Pelagibacteraceae bacterium]|nr:hypothetical protein [Pelagibacteraceae bacterium]
MAIFRQGVRVGPFDIRGGVSRGDLADSAYHKTDKDIRLRSYANTENTIGRFRAAMAAANGYARPARFAVRIFPPTNLESLVRDANLPKAGTGANGPPGRNYPTKPTAKTMSDLSQTLGRQINIHCDSVSMPAHDLQSETVTTFGPPRQMVTGHGFTGTIAASFFADTYLRERHFMEMWQQMAVNHVTHKAGYYDEYIGKMHIFQLASDNVQDHPSYGIEATEVYPETISAIEYNYGSSNQIVKINVGFQYKEWHNLAADTIGGVDFSGDRQVLPPVKARDGGLFGKLPPELQRMARDNLSQATTVLNPIGRLFKGKIFPPF